MSVINNANISLGQCAVLERWRIPACIINVRSRTSMEENNSKNQNQLKNIQGL